MTDLYPDAEVGEMITDGIVLSFEADSDITKGNIVYLSSDMTVSKCTAATRTHFNNRLRYMLKKEYIKRVNRGSYTITEKGTKYMEVI